MSRSWTDINVKGTCNLARQIECFLNTLDLSRTRLVKSFVESVCKGKGNIFYHTQVEQSDLLLQV